MLLGNLIVENKGTEPSFSTNLDITVDNKEFMFIFDGNCYSESNLTSCNLPFLNKKNEMNSQRSFPLKLSPMILINPDTDSVKMNYRYYSYSNGFFLTPRSTGERGGQNM